MRALRPGLAGFHLGSYGAAGFRADALAGLTTAVMLVPQSMGYAMLAGLPPIHGLYASVAPVFVYAFFGSSRHLAVGPVAMDSILVASGIGAIAAFGPDQYLVVAAALAVVVGLVQALLGVVRAGFLVNFLSRPVVSGFTAAAALIIAASQVGPLLGISLPRTHLVHRVLAEALSRASEWSLPTLAIGAGSVFALLAFRRWAPRWPSAIIVVGAATLAVWGLGLAERGVRTVGAVPPGLPGFFFPRIDATLVEQLLPLALTVAFVSFLEAISVGRTFARIHRYELKPNRELVALGLANVAGGLTGGYPVAGGFSRTAVNARAGATSQVAALVTGLVVVLTLVWLTDGFFYLPTASLSAIIVVAVAGLVDVAGAVSIYRVKREDFYLLVVTFVSTLVLGIQYGILVGVAASLVLYLVRTTRPHFAVLGRIPGSNTYLNVARHPQAEPTPGIVAVRIDAQFYFGNVSFLRDTIRRLIAVADEPVRYVVLEASGVNQLDSTAAATLVELDEELSEHGVGLVLTRVKGPVRDVLLETGLLERLASEGRLYISTQRAIESLSVGPPLPDLSPRSGDSRAPADRIGCGMLSAET